MGIGADPAALARFAPIFVAAVENWRKKAKDICEGREPQDTGPAFPGKPPAPGVQTPNAPQSKPGQPFFKV
jgi:hypothetical protein